MRQMLMSLTSSGGESCKMEEDHLTTDLAKVQCTSVLNLAIYVIRFCFSRSHRFSVLLHDLISKY